MTLYYREITVEPALDTEDPVLTLNGSATVTHTQGEVYTDPGANWTDNVDGSGTVYADIALDVDTLGEQVLTYNYQDAGGNDAVQVTRTVTVVAASTGTLYTRNITVTPAPDTIVSVSGSAAGSTITVTTGGLRDLTEHAPTLEYGGRACTSINVTSANTFTCVMPVDGFAIGSTNDFIATIMGVETAPLSAVFNAPSGKQYATFTVPFASFSPDSLWRDDELAGIANAIAVPDQVVAALKSSGTTLQPAGWDVVIDGLGNVSLTGTGIENETEIPTIELQLIDASDGYSISNTMTAAISLGAPAGTLTLGTPAATSTTITLPFTWDGVDASAFNYRVNGGSWVEILSSPIVLTTLTPDTEYTIDMRPMNGAFYGDTETVVVSTTATTDLTPDAFGFAPQEGVAISTVTTSSTATVLGVAVGQSIAVTVTGGEYSISTDAGATWGAWTSSAGTAQLNHQVRVRHTSSASYQTQVTTTLTIGGVAGTFTTTTRADDVGPVVTLTGSATMSVVQGGTFTDLGATATDNVDGNVPVTVSGSVNTAVAGVYTLTYTATDQDGNVGTAIRQVTVAAAGALALDSVPASILRSAATLTFVVSGAAVTPTPGNTTVTYGGQNLPVTAVSTGAGPWTVTLTPGLGLAPIQQSYVGYPLVVTVGSETVQSGNIPFLLLSSAKWIDLTSVATGPGTIGGHFTEFPLAPGHQIAYIMPGVNAPYLADLSISPSGVITYTGTVAPPNPMQYRVITDDGVLSGLYFYNLAPGAQIGLPQHTTTSWLAGRTPSLVIGDTFRQRITLQSDGLPFNVSTATAIACCVVTAEHSAALNAVVTLDAEDQWSTGVVTIVMDADSTAEMAEAVTQEQFGFVEIQATMAGEKYTWFGAVRLVPGFVP